MKRLFILLWSSVVVVVIGLMVLLYVSLIPFFRYIGIGATVVVFVGLCCVITLAIAWTRNRVLIWNAEVLHRRLMSEVIAIGDLVAKRMVDGSVRVLSAEHEAAKVQPIIQQMLPAPQLKDEGPDEATILELFDKGMTLRDIAKATNSTFYQVQKVTSTSKKFA